jgi:2-methylcitrate dehydratase PrpD
MTQSGFTARVVSDVRTISDRELTENVLERTRHAVLDWLGVSIAGSREASARITQKVAASEGGNQVATIIGTPQRATARQAALAVGIAGHSMDYDDMGIGGHPSVVVLPPVFAVAEEIGADGPTTVEAILFGYEAMNLASLGVGNYQYPRGFHSTGTFGALAAAIGVARLLELDDVQMQQAMGVAGTLASGLKSSFGTMGKHLNAGNAAAAGVLAARLVEGGFTGPTDVLEHEQGFAATHNRTAADLKESRAVFGPGLAVEKIMFKPHAACGGTHSAIDGIRKLRDEQPFKAEEVEDVELVVSTGHMTVCAIPDPTTSVEGMFSLRHAATIALAGISSGPSGFTDERVNDPDLVALRQRVTVTPVDRLLGPGAPIEVTVRLKNGDVLEACVDSLQVTPDDQLPAQWRVLEEKFRDLVDPILGEERSEELVDVVRSIDTLGGISELVDKTTGE